MKPVENKGTNNGANTFFFVFEFSFGYINSVSNHNSKFNQHIQQRNKYD